MPVLSSRRFLVPLAALAFAACASTPRADDPIPPANRPIASEANTVNGAQMREANVQSIEEYLNGRVPGLRVERDEQGRLSLRIRGNASAMSEPLLIIDDMQVPGGGNSDALRSLNPREILRVEVLKDASQTAMYGSRGANGVVIVKLRKK
jgi:TonB-dependent SusC/RagA subfamily outer membrane receptor